MFERPNSVIDEIIKDAMERGKFDKLPGEGKPLKLEDESHIPQHLRMAHKLLKDNDLAPDWIVEGKELREGRETWIKTIRREKRRYLKALEDAAHTSSPELARQSHHAAWDVRKASLLNEVNRFNKRVTSYNLRVPAGIPHIDVIVVERELAQA